MKEAELLNVLAAGIRRCRKARGLTIERLAELSKVDAGFLAHIEISAKKPSLKVLGKLIDGLKVAPEELFWSEESGDHVAQRIRALLKNLKHRDQEALLSILTRLRRTEEIHALKTLLRA